MEETQNINVKSNTKIYVTIGLLIILLGFGGFVYWAVTMEIAQGVVARGQVTPQGRKVSLQHQYGGTIEQIHVREGDLVEKDDILITLDDSRVAAELESARWEYLSLLVAQARLTAERLGYEKIKYPPEVLKYKDEYEVQRMIEVQNELFKSRKNSLLTEIDILESQKEGQINYIEKLQEFIKAKENQIKIQEEEIESVQDMVKEGYYPRTKFNQMKTMLNEYISEAQEQLSIIERTKSTIAELDMKILKVKNDYKEEVENQLAEVSKKVIQAREQYQAVLHQFNSMKIRAPLKGIVMDLEYNSVGGVISPGERILSIVPLEDDLIIEAKVEPRDIDSVSLNQETEVRFSALDSRTTPSLYGTVTYISADSLVEQQGSMKVEYYLVKIKIPENEYKKLDKKKVFPGLPAEVIIKAENRTFFEYIMKPLIDRLYFSMREE